jgi:pyruvate dehydrogenase E2 component (dihydrolipoamide acetyltransferase)
MADVVMPRLSDSMEEGTVLQWLKAVGDEIAVGDELVEIETDKANMAYESDVAGTLTEILVPEGETVAIGTPIGRIGDAEEAVSSQAQEEPAPAPPPQTTTAAPAPPIAVEAEDGHRTKASPLARRIAEERQLDLSQLHGSGPGGRIVKADVESASSVGGAAEGVSAAETAKGQTTYEELSKTQQLISRRMSESKATAPHFYLRATVDMSEAVAGREMVKARALPGDVIPSFNDMVVKACALALREHPRANGAYRDGRFELYSRVNVGVAVAAEDALVVPTVFDADRKGLRQIASESRALASKVREGQITPPELSGATFTVSNLGMYGIDGFSAVINPPQAAILAVGAIVERPIVRDGEIATAHLMQVDLACDHRILYGAPAAEFLARVRALLEEPLSLAL